MRDDAFTNSVAMHTLEVVYQKCMNVICFSHTIGCVGEHLAAVGLEG